MGINDATVYMQFKDRDGTISPIFTAKSHQLGDTAGNYVFDLRAKDKDGNVLSHPDSEVPGGEYSFVDANGTPHLFRALRGQEYRIWVDSPLKNEETGNELGYVRQAGGGVPGAWAPVTQGSANGAFYFENYNMQRTGVFLEERAPSVDEKSYMVSPEFSMDEEGWRKPGLGADSPRYSYFGRVWSDAEGGPDRNETGPLYEWKGDQPIAGAKVYASVLSDEGIAEFERLAIADKPFREQAAATKAMIENMRANGKEPILKTVGAVTDAEGRYTIRMGEDIGDRIKNYTYIWAENDGKVLNSFSGFPTPVFQKVNGNAGENPNWGGAVGIPSHANHRWYNINFAEVQADIAHLDIVNYDSYLNPADLPEGINNLEPAKIKLTGALPFSGDNKIRWIGPDGKQIGEDCKVDTLADAANCSLDPEDFKNPGTYVAQLVNAYDVVVGQDSFIAVDKVRQNGEFEPQYEDATAPAGEKTTVEAPKDKDGKEIPEGTTFAPGGQVTDPEGNKIDKPEWVTVKPDGSIEVEPPADAKTGDYTIPVVVTYPDGSRETIEAKVTVEEPDASDKTTVDDSNVNTVDPTNDPQDSGIKVENKDDDTKISAKDEDGNEVPVKIDEDGKVIVTPGEDVDGPINVTIEDPDLPEGKVEVEVPVKDHEKGKDDNGNGTPSDESDKTTVDDSNVNTVDPTNDPQDSGIKVENKDDDTKISAKDEDGNEVPVKIDEDGKVIVTPGEDVDGPINVTIEDPDLPEGKVEVEVPVKDHEKGKDDNGNGTPSDEQPQKPGPSWPIDPNKPGEDEKPGDEDKVTKPSINPVTEDDKEISGTGKPGTDITVVITDKDGNKTEKTVTVGDDGKWKVVVDKNLKAGDKITATDADGNKAEATVKEKPSKPAPKPDDSSDWTGSSNLSERCINTGLGIGIPLLFLIPVGLASQMNIPGLSEFVAPINKQIQDLNTRLQQQAGVFNGPLADQVNGINAQLKRFGADYQQAAGAVALIAAGALAIGLLADACAPGAGEGSSN
ncbi:hypothetical protein WU87_01460 [Corynebacterium minutissimum]|uniref:Uncharacterized protein n=1 Tax=Corynebacterium minutissimum TaxID=38301 RepID=A0ACC4UDM4_9CORY|nr:hypothetical protein WU87_01460 [Corynebacterium minutissimum]